MSPVPQKESACSDTQILAIQKTAQDERLVTSSIAPDCDDACRTFRVTHPFHPLCGRDFELVTFRQNWGEDRVYFHDDNERLRAISASWTSIGATDPFVVISGGRSSFRTADLLALVALIEQSQEGRDA